MNRRVGGGICICLDAPNDLGALSLKLGGVLLVCLLLAVFQTLALVILKQAVFAAKVLVAEGAVADDALSGVLAAVEVAAELPGAGHVDVGGKIMRWRR